MKKKTTTFFLCLSVTLFCLILAYAGEKKDKALSQKLINIQICSDMLHGTDDYFSEDRDAWYADSITPSENASAESSSSAQTQMQTENSTTSSSSSSLSSSSSGSSSSDDSSNDSGTSHSDTSTDSGTSDQGTPTPAPEPSVDYTEPEVPDVSDDCPT